MSLRQGENPLGGRRKKSALRPAALLILIAAAVASYPHLAARSVPAMDGEQADVVFVLTGGENRIPAGIRALKDGKGKELYILGARAGGKIERILPGRKELTAEDLRRLHMEEWSENTLENAFAAKGLVAERNFRKVILVTSDYHMPRAFFAFRAILPSEVDIAASPVRSEWRGGGAFPRTLRLFITESVKYWGYRLFLWSV
jgi:uncharacterized SAM-binding protein YcdF (DUF218 family)